MLLSKRSLQGRERLSLSLSRLCLVVLPWLSRLNSFQTRQIFSWKGSDRFRKIDQKVPPLPFFTLSMSCESETFGGIAIRFQRERRVKGVAVVAASVERDHTGSLLWPEARLLAEYFVSQQRETTEGVKKGEGKGEGEGCGKNGKRRESAPVVAVELGCGAGMCGILWAILNSHPSPSTSPSSLSSPSSSSSHHLFLTDGNQQTLQIAEENVALNISQCHQGAITITILPLLWGEPLPLPLLSLSSSPSLVFGAGLVYPGQSLSSISALFRTVLSLFGLPSPPLSPTPFPQVFLLSYLQRSEETSYSLLHTAHTHGFQWKKVKVDESHSAGAILLEFTISDALQKGKDEAGMIFASDNDHRSCQLCDDSCCSLFPSLPTSLLLDAQELRREEKREEEEWLGYFDE